jgi:hypothetical protein
MFVYFTSHVAFCELDQSISPDLSTDAGQFAMIESVTPNDTKLQFEFIAALPKTKDVSQYENGIGTLKFESLRIISFPGSVTEDGSTLLVGF